MLKKALKGREFGSSDHIEEAITKVWDELTFDEVQNAFHNCMNRPHKLLKMGESILLNKYEIISSHVVHLKIRGGLGTLFTSCPLVAD
jgi:phosphoribosyl 1,2-cyclic phosphodiesterase